MTKKITILLSTIIISGLIYYTFFYYNEKNNKEIALILGIEEASIISVDYSYDPIALCDYDIMEVYYLSSSTISRFVTNSSFKLYDEPYENPEWLKENWHTSPIDKIAWKEICDSAFAIRANSKKRTLWSSEIVKLLSSDNAYFAFYSTDGAIAFYVLDLINRKLYITYIDM